MSLRFKMVLRGYGICISHYHGQLIHQSIKVTQLRIVLCMTILNLSAENCICIQYACHNYV